MTDQPKRTPQESEVAMWHRLSGYPDNVTDDGQVAPAAEGRRAQAEKDQLRAAIARLSQPGLPAQVRSAARLAASYLLAGDAETARRYVARGQDLLAEHDEGRGNES